MLQRRGCGNSPTEGSRGAGANRDEFAPAVEWRVQFGGSGSGRYFSMISMLVITSPR